MSRKYLIHTDYGNVLVEVNDACTNALNEDLLLLHPATDENTQDIDTEVPLRAFSAKMLDIIEIIGTEGVSMSGTMLEMMKQEKATSDLKKIERFAKAQVA
ncbi:MAG: hypothetical protein AAF708_01225 [Deinococcota bacterium]